MARSPHQPPLAGRYWAVVAVALLALCPYIVVSTTGPYLQKALLSQLPASKLILQLAAGLANAGYAFGAVLAAFLVQRFRQRTLFLLVETGFLVGTVLAATAPAAGWFVAGRIVQGISTGLMLIIALPPLITRFPVRRLPLTAVAINVGLFGAVTLGPLVGGALSGHWRLLFAVTAVLALAALGLAGATLDHSDPLDPQRPADPAAFALAAIGTALPFFGVSQLTTSAGGAPIVWLPVAIGLLALIVLIVRQYQREDALMPVRALSTSLPVLGTLTAMIAGAVFVSALELAGTELLQGRMLSPAHAGELWWPLVPGVAVAAVVFGSIFRSRFLPLLVLAGMALLLAGALVLASGLSDIHVLIGAGLLGAGAGATVSPGLFLAALGVPSSRVGRAFALVELLRAEAAFLVGPVLLHVALRGMPLTRSVRAPLWATVVLAGAGIVILGGLYATSRPRLHPPDLERWLEGDEAALHSPPTANRVRVTAAG